MMTTMLTIVVHHYLVNSRLFFVAIWFVREIGINFFVLITRYFIVLRILLKNFKLFNKIYFYILLILFLMSYIYILNYINISTIQ